VHTLATSWSRQVAASGILESGSCNGRRVRSRVNGNVVVMARTSHLSLHVLFLVVVPRALGSVGCLATQVTAVVGLVHARPPRANVVLAQLHVALLVHNTVRRVGRMHTSRMLDKVARATRHPTGQQAIFYALPVSVTEFPQQSKLSTHVSSLSTVESSSDTKRNFKNAANSGRHLNSPRTPTDFAPISLPTTHTPMPPWQLRGRSCIPPPSPRVLQGRQALQTQGGMPRLCGMGLLVPWSVWDCVLVQVPACQCFYVECLSTLSSAGDATLSGFHFGPMTKSIDSHVYSDDHDRSSGLEEISNLQALALSPVET
jgi:hypothetical protein